MTATVLQANNLDIHEVPDGYIVYHTEQDRVHYLNKTAAIIFELCDGKHEPEDIVARVAKAFELDPSAHNEIRAGLESLVKEGLVLSAAK
ncbi:MAG TPA: PqqD family protein [Mesorhizobium sp.]|nr:PqqD family protein [Mesorhizobium sp.]